MRSALARAVLERVRAVRLYEALTLEALAAGHAPQLRFTTDVSRWILAMCSRRAGKTQGIGHRYFKRSLAKARGNRVYLALTGGQARDIMWEPIWKPMLEQWGFVDGVNVDLNETRMVTTFENGSRVRLAGTDDIKAIKKELGAGLDEVTVDEAQDQDDKVLRDLCIRILPPALTDKRGTLSVCGVVPEIEAGFFMELWKHSNWSKHNFSQMENPHLPHAMEELLEYLEKNPGLTMESPVIQRERFGKFKYDKGATAYAYSPDLNGYDPAPPEWLEEILAGDVPDYLVQALSTSKLEALPFCHWTQEPTDGGARFGVMAAKPHPGIDRFIAALDPGTSDRASLSVVGYGSTTEEVQHVFEWSTPRKVNTPIGHLAAWGAVVMANLGPDEWCWDPGSGKMELDTFTADYGIPVIRAANKAEAAGQIRRENDLLTRGIEKVMKGSAAEQDMMKARRDQNAPPAGPWRWDSRWHPDPSESKRYAIGRYFSAFVPEERVDPAVQLRQRVQARFAEKPIWERAAVGQPDPWGDDE